MDRVANAAKLDQERVDEAVLLENEEPCVDVEDKIGPKRDDEEEEEEIFEPAAMKNDAIS